MLDVYNQCYMMLQFDPLGRCMVGVHPKLTGDSTADVLSTTFPFCVTVCRGSLAVLEVVNRPVSPRDSASGYKF